MLDKEREMEGWYEFIAWERSTQDTIDLKKIYIDMTGDPNAKNEEDRAGDVLAGLLLSQIVYWYLPDKDGKTRLTVSHPSPRDRGKPDAPQYLWLAKRRDEWWEEIRLTERQVDRAVKILVDRGLIETARFKFNGAPTLHIRLLWDNFLAAWKRQVKNLYPAAPQVEAVQTPSTTPISPNGEMDFTNSLNPFHQTVKSISPNGEMDFTKSDKSITEITTENTTETTAEITAETTSETTAKKKKRKDCASRRRTVRGQSSLKQEAISAAVEKVRNLQGWIPHKKLSEREIRRLLK